MQTNKEQNQSDLMAVNHDYLPKEYTIESIRKFEPQLADWIEQRIHQARINEGEIIVTTLMKRAEELPVNLLLNEAVNIKYERIAELERGSDERI